MITGMPLSDGNDAVPTDVDDLDEILSHREGWAYELAQTAKRIAENEPQPGPADSGSERK